MPGRIDVGNNRALQAAILSIRAAPAEVRKRVRQTSRASLEPDFKKRVTERASESNVPRLSIAVVARSAGITMSDQNVRMKAGSSTRRLKGGLSPAIYSPAVEFGSSRNTTTKYSRRSRKGKTHTVTRNATRQMPYRRQRGWAFYPTVEQMTPRYASLWVQTAIRTTADALEGRRK